MTAGDITAFLILCVFTIWVAEDLALTRRLAVTRDDDPCRERPSALPRPRCDGDAE